MFKDKKVIIFDMDGTLIDSIDIWNEVDKATIKALGYVNEIENSVIQENRDKFLRKHSKAGNPYLEYYKELKNQYNSTLEAEEIGKMRYEIAQDYLKNKIDYKVNAEKFLQKLKENNFTLIIASTTKKSNMSIYKNENPNIINKANIDDYFSLVYTREDAKEIKPNPEIYLKVINELKVEKKDCLIFEDSLIGIEAAKNAGIEVVAVYDKYSDADREKINELANYQIKDYAEAIDILEKEMK